MVQKVVIAALIGGLLAGCNDSATAQDQGQKQAEIPKEHTVEFYMHNFAASMRTETKCMKHPELAETPECIAVKKAVNRKNAKLRMPPQYPEVEDGGK